MNLIDLLLSFNSNNVGLGTVNDWGGSIHGISVPVVGCVWPSTVGGSNTTGGQWDALHMNIVDNVGRRSGHDGGSVCWNDRYGGWLLNSVSGSYWSRDVGDHWTDDSKSLVFRNRVSKVPTNLVRFDDDRIVSRGPEERAGGNGYGQGGGRSWELMNNPSWSSDDRSGQKDDETDGLHVDKFTRRLMM